MKGQAFSMYRWLQNRENDDFEKYASQEPLSHFQLNIAQKILGL